MECVPYFMAKLEWHRMIGHGVEMICHGCRSNSGTFPRHGGICEEQSSSSAHSEPRRFMCVNGQLHALATLLPPITPLSIE